MTAHAAVVIRRHQSIFYRAVSVLHIKIDDTSNSRYAPVYTAVHQQPMFEGKNWRIKDVSCTTIWNVSQRGFIAETTRLNSLRS